MNQKIKNAAFLFATSYIVARLMTYLYEFGRILSDSNGFINMNYFSRMELCWTGVMLTCIIGGIYYVIYFAKRYCTGNDKMEGAKTVRSGIIVFLIGLCLPLLPESVFESEAFLQVYRYITITHNLLAVAGFALMSAGFGKMKNHPNAPHDVKSGFGALQLSSVLLLIAMGISLVASLCGSQGFNLITTIEGYAMLKTFLMYVVNPVTIAGMAVFIHGWVKITRNNNI